MDPPWVYLPSFYNPQKLYLPSFLVSNGGLIQNGIFGHFFAGSSPRFAHFFGPKRGPPGFPDLDSADLTETVTGALFFSVFFHFFRLF